MRRLIALSSGLLTTLFLGLTSMAIAAPPDIDPGIAALQDRAGFSVLKSFKTPAEGVTGYVVETDDGKSGIVYGLGDYVFSGSLLDAQGNDLTRQYTVSQLPKPDYASVAKVLAQDPHLVSEGAEGAPEIYVFADPNCIFCHKFWQQTRGWVAAGKVQLHWIMVGFLKPSSAGYSAAIINAEDRAGALGAFKESFGQSGKANGIAELDPIPADLKAALEKHSQWMAELDFSGTPGLLFRGADGQWHGQTGVPRQDALAKALGIAE